MKGGRRTVDVSKFRKRVPGFKGRVFSPPHVLVESSRVGTLEDSAGYKHQSGGYRRVNVCETRYRMQRDA
jgi:hypothetical protein